MSKYHKRPLLDEEVCVHAMSRVVQKRFLMDERGMKEMRRILATQATFAGLDVITFCFLKNHFHILLHIDPEKACMAVSDEELILRFQALYGTRRSPSLGVDVEELAVELERQGERADEIRRKMKARMGDVSVFMRELKTRFTFWYNKHYQTVGTFWAERFSSVLVEPGSRALKAVAAYIDLNAVRAGLAETPQLYRYCGLGEAASGRQGARAAYGWLVLNRRRNRGNQASPNQVYEEYVAYVERKIALFHRERGEWEGTATDDSGTVGEAPPYVGYSVKGAAVGSATWIGAFLKANGLSGLFKAGKPIPFRADADVELHAARRWRSARTREGS